MPIYAYRCAACGHTKDVLRKLSDPPLADCPACGQPRFEKQVTAAGFQLMGSGWYATDFRNPPAAPGAAKTDQEKAAAEKGDAAVAVTGDGNGTKAASPAVAPAPALAASTTAPTAPAAPAPSSGAA
jgi:putative FmdB family regulatory protein